MIARDSQGATSTQSFTIEVGTRAINNAPTITSTPKFVASVGSPYQYQLVATDPDTGDTLTYQILSKPLGVDVQINSTTGLLTWDNPAAGQYQIVVGAVDRGGLGAAQGFTLTARNNNAPVITSTAPSTVTPGSTYSYDVKATDAESDRLTYTLDQLSSDKGITVDVLGRLRWNPTISNVGNNPILVTVNDGNGGIATQTINLNVTRDTEAPSLRLIALNNKANLGSNITFQARATDNVKVASLRLTVDGTPVVLDANGIVTVKASRSGTIRAIAEAIDTSGNTKQETFDVLVIDPTDVTAPTVSFKLEGINDGDFVKALTSIRATITDDGQLDYYRLLVAPVDGGDFKELWRNDNPNTINNGLLVEKFDPSLLQNDSYIVRLEVADNSGKISYSEQTVDVAGDLKLGNFRLSFTDLTVPVTGIPISLTRTYDTLTSNTRDDFGYGWRMEFRDTDLRTSVGKPSEEEQLLGMQKAFKDGTKVYITLPGGKREAFTFKPKMVEQVDGDSLLYFAKYFYTPEFVADKGSTSTLTVDGGFISKRLDGNEYFGFQGNPYNPADSLFGGKYTLTTKEGIKYEIDALTGDLLTVTDNNGNKLTYTDAGITSSTGKQITFERDMQGRIAAVLDPMGYLIKYDYNSNGDLISVTDSEQNKTTFIYDAQRPHYLKEIIDPLNRTGAKVEYDETTGRLKKTVSATSNSVQIEYNPENSLQTVKDALGNPTTYEYDIRGNVIRVVDALGSQTRMEYDDNNNLKKVTDANNLVTKYEYDAIGNLKSRTEKYCGCASVTPGTTYYTYNKYGQMETLTLSTGASMTMEYDSNGNMLLMKDGKGNVIQSFTYYDNGLVQTETDTTGTITYEYDRFGNVKKTIDADGSITTMEYAANSKLKKMTEDKGTADTSDDEVSTFEYDKLGREKFTDYGNGIWVKYDYTGAGRDWTTLEAPTIGKMERKLTADGKLAGWVTPNGGTPTFKYDAAGRLFRETDALGNDTTEYSYDAAGRLTSVKDLQTGAVTTKKYDAGGRVIEEVNSLKLFSRYNYNNRTGRLDSTENGKYLTSANGNLVLDAQGKPVVDTTVDIRTYRYEYNGTTTTVIDPLGRKTTSVADDYYLPKETIYQLRDGSKFSEKTEYLYGNNLQEAKDYPTRVVDIAGRDRTFEYDAQGGLKSATDLGDNKYVYTYGDDGLSLITSPTGETLGYEYDALGNLASVKYGNNTFKQMSYRASDNRLGTVTLPNGETITYDYDDVGQVKTQTTKKNGVVTDSTSYTYTEDGAVNTITDSTDTTTYRYDASKRLAGMDYANGSSISYTYDTVGRVKTVSEKGSVTGTAYTTEYNYDVFGNLKSIKDPSGGITTMKYDVVNRLKERTLPNGVKTTYEYDDLNRITSIVHTNAQGQVLTSVSYERKGIGEPSKITREDGSYTKLEYDESLRVKKESNYNAANVLLKETTYSYDASGKRLVQSSVDNTRTFNYTAGYQLDTVVETGETENYDYDQNGRLTLIERDGKKLDLKHDAYDRLTTVENKTTGETTQYIYDGAGNRIKAVEGSQERRFLVAPAMGGGLESTDLITDGSGNLISNYIYGGGSSPFMRLDANGNAVYYLTDAMGTVIGLADGSGTSAGKFLYDAFGNILNGSSLDAAAGGDFRFQGQWLELDSGLYNLRARDYDPATGLFLSRDPVDIIETAPESFNPYQFVYNNPYIYSDPTGMFTITELNATQGINDILENAQRLAFQQAKEQLIDTARGVAGEVVKSALKQFIPFDSVTGILDGVNLSGNKFAQMLTNSICELIPAPDSIKNRVWLEVDIEPKGYPQTNGFTCGDNIPSPEEFTTRYGTYSPITKNQNPRVDAIFKSRAPLSFDRNPPAYLTIDFKRSVSTIKVGKSQWKAIMNYAQPVWRLKNGHRGHQYIPMAMFVTLYNDNPAHEKDAIRQALKEGVKLEIVSFFGKSN